MTTTSKSFCLDLEAGQGLAEHIAPVPIIIQFLEGEAEVTFADKRIDGSSKHVNSLTSKSAA